MPPIAQKAIAEKALEDARRETERKLRVIRKEFKGSIKPICWERTAFVPATKQHRRRQDRVAPLSVSPLAQALLEAEERYERSFTRNVTGLERLTAAEEELIIGVTIIAQISGQDKFIIVLDRSKQSQEDASVKRYGFPGGGRRYAESLADCVNREFNEETDLRTRRLSFAFLKHIALRPLPDKPELSYHAIFTTQINEDLAQKIRPGKEQLEARPVAGSSIDALIAMTPQSWFLRNHANYWREFRLARQRS